MKKLLIALLALSVAGVAFAADPALTFSGALETGMAFTQTDGDDDDGAVKMYNDDADENVRFELIGAYTDGDFGVEFRYRTESFTDTALVENYAYVWGNLFNNMVTFKAGNVDDSAWESEGDDGFDVADDHGLQIQVKPMEGLNLGVKLNVPKTDAYTYEQFQKEIGFGLGYTSDLFNFQAGYKLDSDADADYGDAMDDYLVLFNKIAAALDPTWDDAEFAADDVNASAYFGVNYKGLKGLKAIAEAKMFNLGDSDFGYTEANEEFAYDVNEQINVGILMYQYMYSDSDTADFANLIDFKPYVNYKLNDKVTLGFAVYYGTTMMNVDSTDPTTEIYVKPSATVQLGPKAKFVGFYKYDTLTMDKDFAEQVLGVEDTVTTQTIQLDFIYSF